MTDATSACKVAVFASGSMAIPVINKLREQRQLAGVVLPELTGSPASDTQIHGLAGFLQQQAIPYCVYQKSQTATCVSLFDQWQAAVGLIFTFPYLLPANPVLSFFSQGCFNLHAGPLPNYRGPCPLYWQIRNNETTTRLVIHIAEEKADAGAICCYHDYPIHPLDTLQCLGNQLAWYACDLVAEWLDQLKGGQIQAEQQQPLDKERHFYARRPSAQDCIINCNTLSANDIAAMCRAGSGQPYAATLVFHQTPVVVLQATPVDYPAHGTPPGTILWIGDPEGFILGARDGALRLDILSCTDGIFSGLAFAERFELDAGINVHT